MKSAANFVKPSATARAATSARSAATSAKPVANIVRTGAIIAPGTGSSTVCRVTTRRADMVIVRSAPAIGSFYGQRYWIADPYRYRLPRLNGPQRWVRYGNDVLLIDIRSGRVLSVYDGFFW